jgi:hypothetical protein
VAEGGCNSIDLSDSSFSYIGSSRFIPAGYDSLGRLDGIGIAISLTANNPYDAVRIVLNNKDTIIKGKTVSSFKGGIVDAGPRDNILKIIQTATSASGISDYILYLINDEGENVHIPIHLRTGQKGAILIHY